MENDTISSRKGMTALSPILVFMILYLGVSVAVGDFYKFPISVAMLIASVWGVAIYRGIPLAGRIDLFSRSAGNTSVMYMLWVFILAGAFSALAKGIGAVDATVEFTLRWLPPSLVVPGLFATACFISLSIGTSVGTVVALTPLASTLAVDSGGNVAFFVAVVLGGAFFGDNLSFISDTTIAATRTQGCDMRDKFRANLWIALPAAILTLALYFILGHSVSVSLCSDTQSPWLIIPYLVIIAAAVAGINVTIVLTLGIASAVILAVFLCHLPLFDLVGYMGSGIEGMGGLIIITLLATGMLGLIKGMGGIDWLLSVMTRRVSGRRGAQFCIALLVGMVNLCTANNTIAIITVGSLAKNISTRFGISPRKSASLLDTSSCIVQSLIPYGAQTLLATSLAGITPVAPLRYLYYPVILGAMVLFSILADGRKKT
ncbi:MAG: Na+/H+ antiporter NhaC family protein [Clostridium sp.]|nr:Na+/H+ antiporter NhaC family protein [Clostridium sp.]